MCPVQRSRVFDQIIEGLTIRMEVFDIATKKSNESKNFHDVSFTFGWFEIFLIFYSFCSGLGSVWGYNVTMKLNFPYKKTCFVRNCHEACLSMKRMVLANISEHLVLVSWLHYSIVDVGDGLFYPNERLEMYRH